MEYLISPAVVDFQLQLLRLCSADEGDRTFDAAANYKFTFIASSAPGIRHLHSDLRSRSFFTYGSNDANEARAVPMKVGCRLSDC